jgi:dihydroorotase
VFIERVLDPTRRRYPGLRVVMEHITTREAADYVTAGGPTLAATITPQHLMVNRNAMFRGGIRPHYYCLPVAKREHHRLAVRAAATSGAPCFFLGTDTAPHLRHLKEAECGCAGLFNAPAAIECYATVFAEENALDRLEAFASLNGPAFYRLPANQERITLVARAPAPPIEVTVPGEGPIRVFGSDEAISWSVMETTAA